LNPGDSELRAFIEGALAKGASDRFVADLLKASGWSDKEIYAAFREHFEEISGNKLPSRRESGESARDAFLYLIVFSTLATWTTALGALLFKLIDRWVPDPVALRQAYSYAYGRLDLSFQMACILVAFPVFLYVSRSVKRSVTEEPRNRNSGVRKWLTYIALVVAAGVLICDAVAVLAYLLQGEVSLRFILKAVIVGLIAAGVFGYYLAEVGTPRAEADARRRKTFSVAAMASVAVALILGFTATGGPSAQRAIQADLQRTRDLHHIAEAVRAAILQGSGTFPATLQQVPRAGGFNPRITDPETNAEYEYIPGSGTAYQLCAVFAHDSHGEIQRGRDRFWAHGTGRQCFQLDAKTPTPAGVY
jgi:Domain of unknown function (DUF5671)